MKALQVHIDVVADSCPNRSGESLVVRVDLAIVSDQTGMFPVLCIRALYAQINSYAYLFHPF